MKFETSKPCLWFCEVQLIQNKAFKNGFQSLYIFSTWYFETNPVLAVLIVREDVELLLYFFHERGSANDSKQN